MPYRLDDTICAISTPSGHGGIGVVRLSGPESFAIADALFKGKKQITKADTHTLLHGFIFDKEKTIDEVVVSIFKKPHSYTGQDVIEISAHGGPVIVNEIVRLCIEKGARRAEKGEFTFRAFMNGMMDLSRAEAVCETIQSKTTLSLKTAVSRLEGKLSEKVLSWKNELLGLVAIVEASLDHPDEDIGAEHDIEKRFESLLSELGSLIDISSKYSLLKDGVRVSIAGKPNTGKSSVLNALLERDRAIVSEHPGTTRDIIEETLDIKGIPVVISDTAGLRKTASDPVEKIGQEKAVALMKRSDLLFFVVDSSSPLTEEDRFAAQAAAVSEVKDILVLLNKSDISQKVSAEDVRKILPGHHTFLRISALTRSGFKEIEEFIFAWFSGSGIDIENRLFVNPRQKEVLERAKTYVSEAFNSIKNKESEELAAEHLREALKSLAEITGETSTDEILDSIFSGFCIGK